MNVSFGGVLLSNVRLLDLLSKLPVESPVSDAAEEHKRNVVSWEIFRRLVSSSLEPFDSRQIVKVKKLKRRKRNEIERLRSRCKTMADEINFSDQQSDIASSIKKQIETKTSKDIAELFELDKKSRQELMTNLFSDFKTWAGCVAFLQSLIAGNALLTSGAAMAALSSLGAHAFKAAAQRRQKLRESDFALLYAIKGG